MRAFWGDFGCEDAFFSRVFCGKSCRAHVRRRNYLFVIRAMTYAGELLRRFCISVLIYLYRMQHERRAKYIYFSGREISRERIHVRDLCARTDTSNMRYYRYVICRCYIRDMNFVKMFLKNFVLMSQRVDSLLFPKRSRPTISSCSSSRYLQPSAPGCCHPSYLSSVTLAE